MAKDDSAVLTKIQGTYVPFLKKLIAFLEKNKKATPDNLNKLKAIYTIFTTAPSREQVETFHANEKKLENWYNKAQKEKDGESRGAKRSLVLSDTESSQGASDSGSHSSKRKTFSNAINSESQPAITSVQSITPMPLSQIKKEKIDPPPPQVPVLTPQPAADAPTQPAPVSSDDPITFTCASCQFQTKDETEFMKHARTDHRTDLSMWCKQCGKCFSNAGVLVSHIKERACIKEEMIYKCGVKDCVFETSSGQTFVHHLRHCHKGSPFIFCVHCQKIFTLPHCLILHMQDDCPFKEKNRKNPGAVVSTPTPAPAPTPITVNPPQPVLQLNNVPVQRSVVPTPVRNPVPSLPLLGTPLRGRGGRRGRGRGRVRAPISDSSDSDDPDDPSWRPEEVVDDSNLRRSARWAKKINDVRNPEPSTSGVVAPAKKSFTDADLNKNMITCPCCDFLAAFQSVLEDHYIANHKAPTKNACLICHLKFENSRSFLDHFEEHRKGSLPNVAEIETAQVAEPAPAPKPKIIESTAAPVETPKPVESAEVAKPNLTMKINTTTNKIISSTTNMPVLPDTFDGVLTSIADANLAKPKNGTDATKIPYQAAIHDKNLKDSKLKKFEELKSTNDLSYMKNTHYLKHFFKCGLYNCTYTTDSMTDFSSHLLLKHEGKRYHCCYCLKEYFNCESMARHIVGCHGKRLYQCNKCFYRGYSKAHVQIHLNNCHTKEPDAEVMVCDEVINPNATKEEPETEQMIDTTWPYICAIGNCTVSTYDPKEFQKHCEIDHRTVSVFFCHYCKVDFLSFKRLMNHYRLHGLNTFQCNYCIHGADTKEEILLHLANAHADLPLKAFMRGSHEEASSEVMKLNSVVAVQEDSNDTNSNDAISDVRPSLAVNSANKTENSLLDCEKELYHVIDNKYYPKELQLQCFPRYTRKIMSDVICGISFCQEKFDSISQYISHLRNVHDALNFPCTLCPEKFDSWEYFKNHLLCHGSKLYVCSSKDCGFYDWNKERVKQHKKVHSDTDNVFAVREYSSESSDEHKIDTLELPFAIPSVDTSYECLFCNYKCGDKNIMKNHMYKELAYSRFNCRLCDKNFLSRKEIKMHFINTHPGVDIICSMNSSEELEAVVKTLLQKKDAIKGIRLSESCVMCCRKIRNSLRLQCHQYFCLQKEHRPYECSHCNKSYVNMLALVYHTDQEHVDKPIAYTVVSNHAIDEDIGRNLMKVRMKQLKDVFEDAQVEIEENVNSKLKFYTCSVCPFEADHKFSVQKHIKEEHPGKNGVVIKAMQKRSSQEPDENSNDCISLQSNIRRYSCGFCVRKMFTMQEVENHVKGVHPTEMAEEYFYYYTPDDNISQFSPSDKDIYECAYCKSSKDTLQVLKKHADLMHAEMDFKVKGFVSRVQSPNYLACGHCYQRMAGETDLRNHNSGSHPLLAYKSIGDVSKPKRPAAAEATNEIPNKRVKLGSTVYVCSHCGAAYSSQEQLNIHSRKSHRSLKVEFSTIDQSSDTTTDPKFFKCEFCKFTSEKNYLDKHMASKHKSRVTCSYCNKQFEYASKLKEHNDVAHKDLPLKYSQEATQAPPTPSIDETSNDDVFAPEMEPFSYYGKEPEPIDLTSLTVHMDAADGQYAKLSLVYVAKLFNMFPKVIVKDVLKEKQ